MMKNTKTLFLFVAIIWIMTAKSETYTYEGRLELNQQLANGNYTFIFVIFDHKTKGNYLTETQTRSIKVIDGYFTVDIEFQNPTKTKDDIWMEVSLIPGDDSKIFNQLLPRFNSKMSHSKVYDVSYNKHENINTQLTHIDFRKKTTPHIKPLIPQEPIDFISKPYQKSFDQSLKSLLTEQEFEKITHISDNLRELINAELNQANGIDLKEFVLENGNKLSQLYSIQDNQLVIDITTGANPKATVAELKQIDGIKIIAVASTPSYSVISITATPESLFAMSQISTLRSAVVASSNIDGVRGEDYEKIITDMPPIIPFSQGIANNQAEQAMEVDAVRRVFPVLDGAGISVGTLSDSADRIGGGIAASQATNDLPGNGNIFILIDDSTSTRLKDEGRAMMELIHDISPNLATQWFATAHGGIAGFANNITALGLGGMDIINDDNYKFLEPFYQDGVIAQSIDAFVNQGGVYLSSTGNYANSSYENIYNDSDGNNRHDFATGDSFMQFSMAANTSSTLILQWAQPWSNATTDLDFEVWDSGITSIAVSSTTNNIGGNPIEIIKLENNFNFTIFANISVKHISGPTNNLTIKFVNINPSTLIFNEYTNFAAGTVKPHCSTPKCIGIGAAPWYDRNVAEPFSSQGPHKKFFDIFGNAVGPFTLEKPDFMGVDGVNNTFLGMDSTQDPDSLPNFFGTSAAAPNAAAVVALMMQAAGGPGSLDYQDVKESLRMSAIDRGTPGFDTTYGHGRIHALGAVVLAQGAQSPEFTLYLNQFGNASRAQNLFNATDIDRFIYSSNVAGVTVIDVVEIDNEMDPMIAIFAPFADLRIGVDYDSGSGDDAQFTLNPQAAFFPYLIEVLTETEFTFAADFDLIINGPDQAVTDRTANLNNIGDDLNILSSLSSIGDSRYYKYIAPFNGRLNLNLTTQGFDGMLRIYNSAGNILGNKTTINGNPEDLTELGIIAGNEYTIQVVPNQYLGSGNFELDVNFTKPFHLLSIVKSGNGSGTVTGGPNMEINCGAICQQSLEEDTIRLMQATPNVGHTFTSWSGECNNLGNGLCSVRMTNAKTLTAEFTVPDDIFIDGFEN